jgi:membrane protease YdiL (CAAX protease family)
MLWVWWRYVGRRENLRAVSISDDVWGAALFAGIVGIALSLVALNIANRLTGVRNVPLPTPTTLPPLLTTLGLNFMGATIAGVVEEGAFRGFMQVPIERRFGPGVAIAVTAVAFWLAHLTRAGTLAIAPFYLTYGIVFGLLAYCTGSIYPGMVLHAVGDALAGLAALAPRADPANAAVPASGFDVTFVLLVVVFVVLAVGTVAAFRALADAARAPRDSAELAT